MSWAAIARKDAREIRDSRLLRYLLYLVVIVYALAAYVYPTGRDPVTTSEFAGFAIGSVGLIVPLTAILLGYNAVVGERATGQLALSLSLPQSRRTVLVGKVIGRGGALAAALVAGLVVAAGLVVYPFGELEPLSYAGYGVVTLLFGGAYFAIAVGCSLVTASKQLATAAALGVFFLFVIVWDLVDDGLRVLFEQFGSASGELPAWALFLHGATPGQLYNRIVSGLFVGQETGTYLGPDTAWYLGEWVALGVLGLWTVVPILAGYWRFRRVDL